MTTQIPDEVRYLRTAYAITAVEGEQLFDPADHGLTAGPLGAACWRGYHCAYRIQRDVLILDSVEIGRPEDGQAVGTLFGASPAVAGRRSMYRDARVYRRLSAEIAFSGRLLLGADHQRGGYLNMGFLPAWLFGRVVEIVLDNGRVRAAYDRSAELADVRARLGASGLRPADEESTEQWVARSRLASTTAGRRADHQWAVTTVAISVRGTLSHKGFDVTQRSVPSLGAAGTRWWWRVRA